MLKSLIALLVALAKLFTVGEALIRLVRFAWGIVLWLWRLLTRRRIALQFARAALGARA